MSPALSCVVNLLVKLPSPPSIAQVVLDPLLSSGYHNVMMGGAMLADVVKVVDKDKFSLCKFDGDLSKMSWSVFYSKLQMALFKHGLSDLLQAQVTMMESCDHSCQLCYEFYGKLDGSALAPFDSSDAHDQYLNFGLGIAMRAVLQV